MQGWLWAALWPERTAELGVSCISNIPSYPALWQWEVVSSCHSKLLSKVPLQLSWSPSRHWKGF